MRQSTKIHAITSSATAPRSPAPYIECVRAEFLSCEHSGPPADAVFTRNAVHQLPDFWKGAGA